MAAPRFLPKLPNPVSPVEPYYVEARIGPTRAEKEMRKEICDGTFRPPDAAENASIEEAYALYVPFWRVDIQRSDQSLKFGSLTVGRVGIPIPHESKSDAKAVWMVSARTAFPYEMKHPSTLLPGDAKPLSVSLAALAHGEPDLDGGWEKLEADVDERQASSIATASLAKTSTQSGGLFSESQVTLHAIHFVRYPIWFCRYRYRGNSAPTGNDLFYLGISAVDGTPITAEHPSKLRAGAARVKRFFGLDE